MGGVGSRNSARDVTVNIGAAAAAATLAPTPQRGLARPARPRQRQEPYGYAPPTYAPAAQAESAQQAAAAGPTQPPPPAPGSGPLAAAIAAKEAELAALRAQVGLAAPSPPSAARRAWNRKKKREGRGSPPAAPAHQAPRAAPPVTTPPQRARPDPTPRLPTIATSARHPYAAAVVDGHALRLTLRSTGVAEATVAAAGAADTSPEVRTAYYLMKTIGRLLGHYASKQKEQASIWNRLLAALAGPNAAAVAANRQALNATCISLARHYSPVLDPAEEMEDGELPRPRRTDPIRGNGSVGLGVGHEVMFDAAFRSAAERDAVRALIAQRASALQAFLVLNTETPPALCDEIAFDMPEAVQYSDHPAHQLAAQLLVAAGFPVDAFAILNGNVGCHDPGTLSGCQFRPRALVAHSLLTLVLKPAFRHRAVSIRAYPPTRGCTGCGRHHSDRNARCADCRAHSKASGRIKYFCRHCVTSSYEANHERDCPDKGSRRPCKCGRPGHLQARCPVTAPRHFLLHKVELPREMRAALDRAAGTSEPQRADSAPSSPTATPTATPTPTPTPEATANPASFTAPARPARPTDPAPMRAATASGQRPITQFLGAPRAPWAPATQPSAQLAPSPAVSTPPTSVGVQQATAAPPQQPDALERVLAAMASMQQQMDTQLKLITARLAALESSPARAAPRQLQLAKKHKADAPAVPLDTQTRSEQQEPAATGAQPSGGLEPRCDDTSAGTRMDAAATLTPAGPGKNKRSLDEDGSAPAPQPADSSAGTL